jgi:hypothetical protein
MHHAGLRTNALIYDQPVTVSVSWKVLPSGFPGSGILDPVSAYLVHKTTDLDARVDVYGLIDFTTVAAKVATVNKQARTITLSLPNPTISKNTTYIWSVNGVQEQTGLLNTVEQSLIGPLEAVFNHPQLSFNARPALMDAEAAALTRAQHGGALDSCGEQEIVHQLTAAVNLTPAYRGYMVDVRWPSAPAHGVNCAALQRQLARAGS